MADLLLIYSYTTCNDGGDGCASRLFSKIPIYYLIARQQVVRQNICNSQLPDELLHIVKKSQSPQNTTNLVHSQLVASSFRTDAIDAEDWIARNEESFCFHSKPNMKTTTRQGVFPGCACMRIGCRPSGEPNDRFMPFLFGASLRSSCLNHESFCPQVS